MAFIRFSERPAFRNPWVEFERIRQGLDELSRSYMGRPRGRQHAGVFPALNIREEADRLVVSAELPGVKAEDLEIALEGETLSIQGRRAERRDEGNPSYHRREIQCGSFSRALSLPVQVDAERIDAKLADGLLTIILMKAAAATPRRIRVNAE